MDVNSTKQYLTSVGNVGLKLSHFEFRYIQIEQNVQNFVLLISMRLADGSRFLFHNGRKECVVCSRSVISFCHLRFFPKTHHLMKIPNKSVERLDELIKVRESTMWPNRLGIYNIFWRKNTFKYELLWRRNHPSWWYISQIQPKSRSHVHYRWENDLDDYFDRKRKYFSDSRESHHS